MLEVIHCTKHGISSRQLLRPMPVLFSTIYSGQGRKRDMLWHESQPCHLNSINAASRRIVSYILI